MVLKILKEHSQDTNLLLFELIFNLVTAEPHQGRRTLPPPPSLGDCHGCPRVMSREVLASFCVSRHWQYLGHSSCSDKSHPCCSSQDSTRWGCSANICQLLAMAEIKSFFSLKPVVWYQLLAAIQSLLEQAEWQLNI